MVSASSEDNTENQNLKRTIKLYKGKIESLKEEMFCFQKCAGFDFLPEKTRVSTLFVALLSFSVTADIALCICRFFMSKRIRLVTDSRV